MASPGQNPYADQIKAATEAELKTRFDQKTSDGTHEYGDGGRNGNIAQLPFDAPILQQTLDSDGNLLPQYQVDHEKAAQESDWGVQNSARANETHNLYRDQAASDTDANRQYQQNMLAETGGLSAGASSRIGDRTQGDLGNQYSALQSQNSQNLYGIDQQDYENQVTAQEYNIDNTLQNINLENAFDWQTFDTGATAYGSQQMSQAMIDSAKAKARQGHGDGPKPYELNYDQLNKYGLENVGDFARDILPEDLVDGTISVPTPDMSGSRIPGIG